MLRWIFKPLWFILPSYLANTTPIFVKRWNILNCAVDFGLKYKGKSIFGRNKTWRGLFFGSLAGILIAVLQDRGVFVGFILGAGALLGDLTGSFIKRRLNISPSQPHVLLDQTPYVLVPTFLYALFLDYSLSLGQSIFLFLFSLWIHRASNLFYFKIGLKEVPF